MNHFHVWIAAAALLVAYGQWSIYHADAAEPDKLVRRVYDVRALCADEQSASAMARAIAGLFPETWADVGGNATQTLNRNGRLEVLQTVEAHQVISRLLRSCASISTARARNQLPREKDVIVGQAGAKSDQGVRLTTRVYDVSGWLNAAGGGSTSDCVNLLQSRIAPASWNVMGGPGNTSDMPALQLLVISQAEEAHREIQAFLSHRR